MLDAQLTKNHETSWTNEKGSEVLRTSGKDQVYNPKSFLNLQQAEELAVALEDWIDSKRSLPLTDHEYDCIPCDDGT